MSSTSSEKKTAAPLVPVKSSPRNQPKFQEGEKVLCYHGTLLYEAKCLKVDVVRPGEHLYLVHYNGWSKNWDEWVPIKRILKLNEENLRKQEELVAATRQVPKEVKDKVAVKPEKTEPSDSNSSSTSPHQGASTVPSSNTRSGSKQLQQQLPIANSASNSKRRQPDEPAGKSETKTASVPEVPKKRICVINIHSKQNTYHTNVNVRIRMPRSLKEWLIDDFDAINQQNKLVKLPVAKTVVDLLNDFYLYKLTQPITNEAKNALKETNAGLVKYFDAMLGSQLLYKFERVQYTEILAKSKPMSEVYGAFHFLRLLEKMEQIFAFTPLDPKSLEALINHVNSVLIYLDDKKDELFSIESYVLAPPDYVRSAI